MKRSSESKYMNVLGLSSRRRVEAAIGARLWRDLALMSGDHRLSKRLAFSCLSGRRCCRRCSAERQSWRECSDCSLCPASPQSACIRPICRNATKLESGIHQSDTRRREDVHVVGDDAIRTSARFVRLSQRYARGQTLCPLCGKEKQAHLSSQSYLGPFGG